MKGQSQDHSDFKALYLELGHVLLLNQWRVLSIDVITFTLVTLKGQRRMSLRFGRPISRKGADPGYVLLLNTTRKSPMGSLAAQSHLTLSDIERSNLRSLGF